MKTPKTMKETGPALPSAVCTCMSCRSAQLRVSISPTVTAMKIADQFDVWERHPELMSAGWKVAGKGGRRFLLCAACAQTLPQFVTRPRHADDLPRPMSLSDVQCMKCGAQNSIDDLTVIKPTYCTFSESSLCPREISEHLHWSCSVCKYAWATQVQFAKM